MTMEHHASHVILSLAHKCREAVCDNNIGHAQHLSSLITWLEVEFPEARDEVERWYPVKASAETGGADG